MIQKMEPGSPGAQALCLHPPLYELLGLGVPCSVGGGEGDTYKDTYRCIHIDAYIDRQWIGDR